MKSKIEIGATTILKKWKILVLSRDRYQEIYIYSYFLIGRLEIENDERRRLLEFVRKGLIMLWSAKW